MSVAWQDDSGGRGGALGGVGVCTLRHGRACELEGPEGVVPADALFDATDGDEVVDVMESGA
ncbi:MAG TPA: hypothetical protein VH591_22415 [Ktedonobacterales bacterium]